ncbi:hypothetical protein [Coleofasciculus sp.]|uniref:hypothetical protein n=1 Tax=Coleofasciculus sp. TaxID=3100458 RepID=UPI004063D2C3
MTLPIVCVRFPHQSATAEFLLLRSEHLFSSQGAKTNNQSSVSVAPIWLSQLVLRQRRPSKPFKFLYFHTNRTDPTLEYIQLSLFDW